MLVVAHFDHRLRGAESQTDCDFVAALCRDHGLRCRLGAMDRLDRAPDGIESAAREARYRFLQATAEELGFRYVATGHTADDQAETILHRIVRGTGLAGLAGMTRFRPLGPAVSLARPLLAVRRAEVLRYLADLGQPFRTDSSNADPAFTRNRLRALLAELAEQFNPDVAGALLRLGDLAAENQEVIAVLADDLLRQAVLRADADGVVLRTDSLRSAAPYLVREAFVALWRQRGWPLQAMGRDQWDLLAAMASDRPGPRKREFPGPIVVVSEDETLILRMPAGQ